MNISVKNNLKNAASLIAALCCCLALLSCSQPAAKGQKVPAIAPAGTETKRASAEAALGTEVEARLQESEASFLPSLSPSPQLTPDPAAHPTAAESSPTPSQTSSADDSPEDVEGVCAVDFLGQGKKVGDVWVFQSFDEGLVGDENLCVSLIHVGNEAGELLWSLEFQAPVTEINTISEVFPCRDMLYI